MTPQRKPRTLVTVTAEDIENGEVDGLRCPVALALHRRGWPCACMPAGLGFSQTYLVDISLDGMTQFPAPESVARFVERFDGGLPVKPFRFYLPVPPPKRRKR